jgi:hypothetical protein
MSIMSKKFIWGSVVIAILIIAIFALAIAAIAQEPAYTGDRPGFSNSPYSIGNTNIGIESGFAYNYSSNLNQYTQSNLLRVGCENWFEMRFGVDMGTYQDVTAHNYVGVKDINIGVKCTVVQNAQYLPDVALLGTCYVPEIELIRYIAKTTPATIYLLAGKTFGKVSLLGNLGAVWDVKAADNTYFINPYATTYAIQVNYIFNISIDVTKTFNLFAEAYGFFAGAFAPTNGIDAGIVITITPNLFWDLSGGITYVQGLNNSFINTGIAWRFSDKTNEK